MLNPPDIFSSFIPPHITLMGPGPSAVHPRVLNALARPTIGHLDPAFVHCMDEIKALLQYAFQTKNPLTLAVSGPGTAGMETCVANLLEPGDTAVVCINGVFGKRIQAMVERCGATAICVEQPWGEAVDPEAVAKTLQAHPEASVLAFVHAETSTGALSDAQTLAAIARSYDCLSLVDTVTSLGGVPLFVDEWGLDAVYSGTQKCLSAPPGLSPVTFSARAQRRLKQRKIPVQSWFLDLSLVMDYWGQGQKRSYHHTAPVNSLYALHESLLMLKEEGLKQAWERHYTNHRQLREGLEALGLSFVVEPSCRLPQLNTVWIPEGYDDQAVRNYLLQVHFLEIGGGLGDFAGKAWRMGLMGYSSRPQVIQHCLAALEDTLGNR
jgi:alanine-glyoxylate transaminase / serine-glyoxylate transaminase / serine-pyruvate transaminase